MLLFEITINTMHVNIFITSVTFLSYNIFIVFLDFVRAKYLVKSISIKYTNKDTVPQVSRPPRPSAII